MKIEVYDVNESRHGLCECTISRRIKEDIDILFGAWTRCMIHIMNISFDIWISSDGRKGVSISPSVPLPMLDIYSASFSNPASI